MTAIRPNFLAAITIGLTYASPIHTIPTKGNSHGPHSGLPSTSSFVAVPEPLSNLHLRSGSPSTVARSEHGDQKPVKGDTRGALIGGTIAAVVIALLIILASCVLFWLVWNELGTKKETGARGDTQKGRRSTREVVSGIFRYPVSHVPDSDTESTATDDTRESRRSYADSIIAQIGTRGELVERQEPQLPQAPRKAANVLGIGDRAFLRPLQSQPLPRPLALRQQQPERPRRPSTPDSQEEPGCRYSPLSKSLFTDTLHPPEPERFSGERRNAPWLSDHQPQEDTVVSHKEGHVSQQCCFLPEIKSHPSPLGFDPVIMEESSTSIRRSAAPRTVKRNSSEGQTFALGDYKF